MNRKYIVALTQEDKLYLEELSSAKTVPKSTQQRIKIFLEMDMNNKPTKTHKEIADMFNISRSTLINLSRTYCEKGIKLAVNHNWNPKSAKNRLVDK